MRHELAPLALAMIGLAFVYAGYVGYCRWRPRYSILVVFLVSVAAGAAKIGWDPEPPGAGVFVFPAAVLIGAIARLFGPREPAPRAPARIAIIAMAASLVLLAAGLVMQHLAAAGK